MANFFIISALNYQNDFKKRKIQARCPSLAYTGSRKFCYSKYGKHAYRESEFIQL